MTQEEKQLLLKDLCARLPYGVMCRAIINDIKTDTNPEESLLTLTSGMLNYIWINSRNLKPYLRPISSMTEEEKKKFKNVLPCSMTFGVTYSDELKLYHDEEYDGDYYFSTFSEIEDWLNEHHFDYRGLIPMGLALEAPKDMYRTE